MTILIISCIMFLIFRDELCSRVSCLHSIIDTILTLLVKYIFDVIKWS